MTEERLIAAIGRLDRALSRAESAAARLDDRPPAAADPALAERHERLRDAAGEALAMLDDLIGAR